ncbi:MAG: hypothetical protein M3O71_21635 [Bacteroidota bacterium]|nr:hypothetical protein [Bacteroidota bacterium]
MKTKTLILISLFSLLISIVKAQRFVENFIDYPFIGTRYYINEDNPNDYFLITISRQGLTKIFKHTDDRPETIYEGIYKHIISDNYGAYKIERMRFDYQNPYDNNKVSYYYPDKVRNAVLEEKIKITNNVVKHFNGPFEIGDYKGQAHYDYVNDNQGSQVYNGAFTFAGIKQNLIVFNANGNFKNDYKTGIWTSNVSYKRNGMIYYTERLTANYEDGILNGEINLSGSLNVTSKIISYTYSTSGKANVINNSYTGKFYFKRAVLGSHKVLKPMTLIGQFNDSGFCDGKWTMIYEEPTNSQMYEANFEFINGVLVSYTNMNQKSGELENSTENAELIEDAKQLSGTQSVSSGRKWKVQAINAAPLVQINEIPFQNFGEIQLIFGDPTIHMYPKGYVGELPIFKIRALDFN